MDYYRILQVDSHAEAEVIEAAFRRLARKYHPDVYNEDDATERMKQLNTAYDVLRDQAKRRTYDLERDRQASDVRAAPSGPPAKTSASPRDDVRPAKGLTLTVQHDSGEIRTIKEAIRRAAPNTRILIRPGIYVETIALDMPLELIGDGPKGAVVIEGASAESTIQMRTNKAVVRNVSLRSHVFVIPRGKYIPQWNYSATVDISQGQLTLIDCEITGKGLQAIDVTGKGTSPIIEGCKIHDSSGYGVRFAKNSMGSLADCEIVGNKDGIWIYDGGHPTIERCAIHDNNQGIIIWEKGNVELRDCDIYNNSWEGVKIAKGELTMRGCRVRRNSMAGVSIGQGGKPRIKNCEINYNKGGGIAIGLGATGLIEECDLSGNGVGAVIRDERAAAKLAAMVGRTKVQFRNNKE